MNPFHHSSLLIILRLFIVLSLQPSSSKSSRKSNSNFNILGLFTVSGCSTGEEYLCQNAFVNLQGIHRGYQSQKWPQCFIDAKNSEVVVSELIFSFIEELRHSDVVEESSNSKENVGGEKNGGLSALCINRDTYGFLLKTSNVGYQVILTYLTFHLTRLVSYLLLNEDDVILVSLTQESMYPYQLVERPTFVFSHEASYGVDKQHIISGWMKEIDLTYAAVIYSKENSEDAHLINRECDERVDSAFCYYMKMDSSEQKRCYKEILIDTKNENEVNKTLNMILSYPDLRFLFFNGYWSTMRGNLEKNILIKDWDKKKGKGPFFLIPFERPLRKGEKTTKYSNLNEIPGGYSIVDLLNMVKNIEEKLIDPTNSHIMKALLQDGVTDLIPRHKYPFIPDDVNIDIQLWMKIPHTIRKNIAQSVLRDSKIITKFVVRWKKLVYPEFLSIQALTNDEYKNPRRVLQQTRPYCNRTIPDCVQGYQLQHGQFHE